MFASRAGFSPLIVSVVSIASFLIGVISTFSVSYHLTNFSPIHTSPVLPPITDIRTNVHTDLVPTVVPTVENTSSSPEEPDMPLALKWVTDGHKNPWSFSILRHNIFEMQQVVEDMLKKDIKLPRVVVTMTSLPGRFNVYAPRMIEILTEQVFRPDAIYINVPRNPRRSSGNFTVPSWIRKHPLVTILRPKIDMGPATKLIPAIRAEKNLGHHDSRVITVDDDNEGRWNTDTLLELYAYSLFFPKAAIGLTGWNVTCMVSKAHCSPGETGLPERQFPDRMYNFIRPASDMACHTLQDWLPSYYTNCMGAVRKNSIGVVDVLEGYRGVVYQPKFFDLKDLESIADSDSVPEFFMLVDDVWFSGWLSMRNVKRVVVNPAIHADSPLYFTLRKYAEERPEMVAMNDTELKDLMSSAKPVNEGTKVEQGLHDLGNSFISANHDGAVWFEKKGGWTKDMWARPAGFKYPGEEDNEKLPQGKDDSEMLPQGKDDELA